MASNPPKKIRKIVKRSVKNQRVSKPNSHKSSRKGYFTLLLSIAILLSSAGLIGIFAWISVLFIFNPQQLGWVNTLLPQWAKIPLSKKERPLTLTQIKTNVTKLRLISGDLVPLDGDTTQSFLLPVLKQRNNCHSDCQSIVEIRVYKLDDDPQLQSKPEKYYNLATAVAIQGPDESFAIAPLVEAATENPGSNIPLPLTSIKRFENGTPELGTWFYLQGKRSRATGAIAYGHVIFYNPQRDRLQIMLSWTSPNGHNPQWSQVTGGGEKELIIDQTVGFEPNLLVYQVKPVKLFLTPYQLEQISLNPPALKDKAFEDALLLARTGLWTSAFEWLQFIQKQRKREIAETAQAQIDTIRLHAQLSKTHADTSWASPSQEALVNLIDGRWAKALQIFTASPENAQEITALLKSDSGRLWNRVEAALKVNSNREEAIKWGALILAAKKGPESAKSWLKEQPKATKSTIADFESLLKVLSGETAIAKFSTTHVSRIIGTVVPITKIKESEWLQPEPKTHLKAANQLWYQVEVNTFNNGKRWLGSPFSILQPVLSTPEKDRQQFLWETLGLKTDPNMQIIVWLNSQEQQTVNAKVTAVQLQGSTLRLLVAADRSVEFVKNSQPPLALTNSALEWVQPTPVTVEELYREDPQIIKTILPAIWRSLQADGELPGGLFPKFPQLMQKLGHYPIQVLDLTGNGKPEIILTISNEAIASLNKASKKGRSVEQLRPRTLILSDQGKVIYTDFGKNSEKRLTAIAKVIDGGIPGLLVDNAKKYRLLRWSQQKQRFE